MHNERGYNFGAGPATLPLEVLKSVQDELLNWHHTGMSILEIGHRTPEFIQLLENAERKLRQLLNIPSSYHVLFLGGATRNQFSLLPLNLLRQGRGAYHITGMWSKMAYEEAARVAEVYCVASSESQNFYNVKKFTQKALKAKTRYFYYTPNETVNGVFCDYPRLAQEAGLPIVADMTSCLLTSPINVQDYAMIIAGAQKNIANAGLTLLIIDENFLKEGASPSLPRAMDYQELALNRSLYATPPTFNCYLADKMFDWVHQAGGVEVMKQRHAASSRLIYDLIDASHFYEAPVHPESRSPINLCFNLHNPKLLEPFIEQATAAHLLALRGHRGVGGLRASFYNSMPQSGIMALKTFMQHFQSQYGS